MALTATEEALVRQLLDQQAAILSLAGNEATITSKLGATKVTLSDLVSASAVADADLLLMRQGTNDKSVTPLLLRSYTQDGMATQKGVQAGDYNTSVAAGTANALTGDYTPNVAALEDGLTLYVRATAANTTTTPTFSPDGLTAKTIVKGNNLALATGDIAGAGHWLALQYDLSLDKWVLMNPASGVISTSFASDAETQAGSISNKAVTPAGLKSAVIAGAGRTWQNNTGSRALNTTYTNTTGRPLYINVQATYGNGASTQWVIGAATDVSYESNAGANPEAISTKVVVPPGETYRLNVVAGSVTSIKWYEL